MVQPRLAGRSSNITPRSRTSHFGLRLTLTRSNEANGIKPCAVPVLADSGTRKLGADSGNEINLDEFEPADRRKTVRLDSEHQMRDIVTQTAEGSPGWPVRGIR